MKNLFILGMVLLSATAFAGNEKGNGGGVHYCANQKSLELYDVYEAQARFGYAIKESSLAVDVQVRNAVEKIKKNNPYIGKLVQEKVSYLKNGHMIVRAKVKLTPIGDANILIVDEGCSYKQLANWDEVSGNLIVNKDFYDRMSNTNQAALYIHETLYKVGRDLNLITKEADGTSTSDEIRRMVGEIFSSENKLEQLWTVVDPQIEIDRAAAEFATVSKKMDAEVEACSKSVEKYKTFMQNLNGKTCDADVKGYMETYYESIKVCISSDVSLKYNYSNSIEVMFDSNAYSLIAARSGASEAVRGLKNEISYMHESFMSKIMKCKN
jgi:hypothetical protein